MIGRRNIPFRLLLAADVPTFAAASVDLVDHLKRLPHDDHVGVWLRHKAAPVDEQRRLLSSWTAAAPQVRWLVHTHPELLDTVGDNGVGLHLDGQADARRRPRIGDDVFVTTSRHAGDALDDDALDGVDGVLMSPVFAPTSKPDDTRPVLGVDGLGQRIVACSKPVFALGGITVDNIDDVLQAGAAGVVVLGAWVRNPNVVDVMLQKLERVPK